MYDNGKLSYVSWTNCDIQLSVDKQKEQK